MPARHLVVTTDKLIDSICRTAHAIDVAFERELRATNLTHAQAALLRALARRDGRLAQSELAREVGCVQSTVSKAVVELARRGWVDIFTYRNESWRREIQITLAGRQIVTGIQERLAPLARRLSDVVAPRDAAVAERVLEAVAQAASETAANHDDSDEGAEVIVTKAAEPTPWTERAAAPPRAPVKQLVAGIPREEWEKLSLLERQAQEAAQFEGRTREDVLLEWTDKKKWLAKKYGLSGGNDGSP